MTPCFCNFFYKKSWQSLAVIKNIHTFATANKEMSERCVSSAWLECLPVTQEVTGSSPVRTAKVSGIAKLRCVSSAWLECLPVTQEVTGSSPVRTAKILKACKFEICGLYSLYNYYKITRYIKNLAGLRQFGYLCHYIKYSK